MEDAGSIVAALDAAFSRAAQTSIFLASSNSPKQADLENNVIKAARGLASSPMVVKLSTATPCMSPRVVSGVGRAHREIEQALRDSGLPHAVLRANYFMVAVAVFFRVDVCGLQPDQRLRPEILKQRRLPCCIHTAKPLEARLSGGGRVQSKGREEDGDAGVALCAGMWHLHGRRPWSLACLRPIALS